MENININQEQIIDTKSKKKCIIQLIIQNIKLNY